MKNAYQAMQAEVYEANQRLNALGLVILTWGNVSAIDRARGCAAIKPSGVDYKAMRPEDIVVVDMEGRPILGDLRPSSDLRTHLALYRRYPAIGGVVHTHSRHAVAFAQAERGIPCYGTTHADSFYGEIPCTRQLSPQEIEGDYEANTGLVICETFDALGLDASAIPGVLAARHGPFAWGPSAAAAVENALILEEVARMALLTEQCCRTLDRPASPAPQYLLDKHYLRKHGANAYYGQR
ncbi:MAG: L-ribulose-5-phosphate 4-epimerase [Clostridia bacterium]|nr:L-ribulose-5-phosphate 4-epimerase [Clostridia bacterium]